MAIAVVGTLVDPKIESFVWIGVAMVFGTRGRAASRVALTAVPQRTALSPSAWRQVSVGTAKFYMWSGEGN